MRLPRGICVACASEIEQQEWGEITGCREAFSKRFVQGRFSNLSLFFGVSLWSMSARFPRLSCRLISLAQNLGSPSWPIPAKRVGASLPGGQLVMCGASEIDYECTILPDVRVRCAAAVEAPSREAVS